MEVGLRVVRGPDWQWEDQDGGDGHVGTVVEIGGRANNSSPDKTVVVQWDNGMRTNYRCGYQNAYDLRVLDNAPCGVKHVGVSCRGCQRKTIKGLLFKCTKCADLSLCSACYFGDKHEMTHSFYRIDTPASRSVKVPKRAESERKSAKGLFVGASVMRGHDWSWNDQDGGATKTGRVQEIRGWEQESFRSVACVHWFTSRISNVYRVGHKGKVDVKCVAFGESSGGNFYSEHLPVLGQCSEQRSGACRLRIGDAVRVSVQDVSLLQRLQADHGGWNARMSECVGKTGRVHRITEKGDIRVQYERNVRWTFSPEVLLRVSDSEAEGEVGDAEPDADANPELEGDDWTPERLLRLVAQGTVEQVEQMLARGPADCVDRRVSGKTPLHAAAQAGRADVLQLLLQRGAQVDLEDDEGDTPLHYAVAGGHTPAVTLLLEHSAAPNRQAGERRFTPLHVAASKQLLDCLNALLRCPAIDVNVVDAQGDTPLHHAVARAAADASGLAIVDALVRHSSTEPLARNKRGFNAVHQAALKGSVGAMRCFSQRWPATLDTPKDDGFGSLHIAALNGHLDVVHFLLDAGVAIDARTHRRQTPLMLAVAQNYAPIAALLVDRGADANAVDDCGDSCLFLCLVTFLSANPVVSSTELDPLVATSTLLERLLGQPRAQLPPQLVLMAFLMQNGARWNVRNQRGETVFDYVKRVRAELLHTPRGPPPAPIERTLQQLAVIDAALPRLTQKPALQQLLPPDAFCMLCQDELADVLFAPCRHQLVCLECCRRIKKCMRCQTPIERKLLNNIDVASLGAVQPAPPAQARPLSSLSAVAFGVNINAGATQTPPTKTPSSLNSLGTLPRGSSTVLVDVSVTAALESENSELRRKLQDARQQVELKVLCSICMDNEKTVAFACGHTYCAKCAEQLTKTCPTCRKPITKRFNVFI